MAGSDVEMLDVSEMLGGGAVGVTPAVAASAPVPVVGTEGVEFVRGTLEARELDVRGGGEDGEYRQDCAMTEMVIELVERPPVRIFGEYVPNRWYNMTPEEWTELVSGKADLSHSCLNLISEASA